MQVTGELPGFLLKIMSNGHASTYLKASRELAHTDLLSGDRPAHLGTSRTLLGSKGSRW